MSLASFLRLERLARITSVNTKKGVKPVMVEIRSGPIFDAVSKLRNYLQNPNQYPDVQLIIIDDEIKPRKI